MDLTLGLLQRFHLVRLPGDLSRISDPWILAIAGGMYLTRLRLRPTRYIFVDPGERG
jgi:hypothetical protein